MPVDAELLEILACPNCKTPVKLVKTAPRSSAISAIASTPSRTTSR